MMTASQLIKNSITVYKQYFKRFTMLMMVVFSAICIASIISLSLYFAGIEGNGVAIFRLLLTMALIVLNFVVLLALIADIKSALEGQNKTGAIKKTGAALKFLLPAIWLIILSLLIWAGAFLLFIIPIIIVMVWYAFSVYALIIDGKTGWQAMKFSKQLVEGRWWKVFWLLIAPAFAFGILFFFVDKTTELSANFILNLFNGNALIIINLIIQILKNGIDLILAPLPIISMVILYEYLKKTKIAQN